MNARAQLAADLAGVVARELLRQLPEVEVQLAKVDGVTVRPKIRIERDRAGNLRCRVWVPEPRADATRARAFLVDLDRDQLALFER